jgi:hypothetical protein
MKERHYLKDLNVDGRMLLRKMEFIVAFRMCIDLN